MLVYVYRSPDAEAARAPPCIAMHSSLAAFAPKSLGIGNGNS